ncbi:MAG: hypothetical protein ACPHAN_01215 [Pseudomonadales bacterium]
MTLSFSGIAHNQSPNSQNQIHSDEMAQRYGFKGGLVPGVTLSAYLTQPGVLRWGTEFLNRGFAEIKVVRPVYDTRPFDVAVTLLDEKTYSAKLIDETGSVRAESRVGLRVQSSELELPKPLGLQQLPDVFDPPLATPETFRELKAKGCFATRYRWHAGHAMASYFLDPASMPSVLRVDTDVSSAEGYANTSFILGCANWIFAANALMNPWVHLQTTHHNFAAITPETEVLAEMVVLDLFERRGHQFADIRVGLFDASSLQPLAEIEQRAIYQLRS